MHNTHNALPLRVRIYIRKAGAPNARALKDDARLYDGISFKLTYWFIAANKS